MTRASETGQSEGAAIAGPYWVRTNTNGTHDVCGRHAKVIRSYAANQMAMADADCRRLQKGHVSAEKALIAAAPALYEVLLAIVEFGNSPEREEAGRAALALAKGDAR